MQKGKEVKKERAEKERGTGSALDLPPPPLCHLPSKMRGQGVLQYRKRPVCQDIFPLISILHGNFEFKFKIICPAYFPQVVKTKVIGQKCIFRA